MEEVVEKDLIQSDLSKYKKYFAILISGIFIFRFIYILFSGLELSPEEAYYWCYSQNPALCYFDHPPMVAWIIWFFTHILPIGEFSVRIGAVILSTLTIYFVYKIASKLYDEKIGFYSAVLYTIAFVFSIYATGITPDTPFLFFWALSLYLFMRACLDGKFYLYVLLGISMGLAYLSKYPAVFLPISFIIFLLTGFGNKERWKGLITSIVISGLFFIPVVLWNSQHSYCSFLFQSSERVGKPGISLDKFIGPFLLQGAFVTPVIFFSMLYVFYRKLRENRREFAERFLLSASLPVILFFYAMAFVASMKTNWPAPGYIAGLMLLAFWWDERYPEYSRTGFWGKFRKSVAIFGVVLAILMNLLAYIQPIYPAILPGLSKANTMTGWKMLGAKVLDAAAAMQGEGTPKDRIFICGHGYQIASELKFYKAAGTLSIAAPADYPVYSNNILGEPALAFDVWQPRQALQNLEGTDAIVVADGFIPFDESVLKKFFIKYEELEPLSIDIEGVHVRIFRIFKCYNYMSSKLFN